MIETLETDHDDDDLIFASCFLFYMTMNAVGIEPKIDGFN